jgi:glycerol uptake facilitator-like aquaporin
MSLGRRAVAEGVATAILLATVVGSGIMGERLAAGNAAMALLATAIATGAILVVLILSFGAISGAHMNPVVSVADAWHGGLAWSDVGPYVAAQLVGAVVGVATAHGMFEEPLFVLSRHARQGPAQLWSEAVATFGLLATILGCSRHRSLPMVAAAVGAYVTAAYWFTASTSFANPAVTLARSLTDTLAGIRPTDVPGFVGAQVTGAFAATALFDWLAPVSVALDAPATHTPAPAVERRAQVDSGC